MEPLFRTFVCFALLLVAIPAQAANVWRLIAWSDLGMNQMERDYSVFSIYPPGSSIQAQLVDPTGVLYKGTSGVKVTYEALADPSGSVNSTTLGKTNFWQFAAILFNVGTAVDTGLSGNRMPGSGNAPQSMLFDAIYKRFTATGVPITPYDDNWNLNYYPVLRLTARDSSGAVLATTRVTIPISNEVECRGCHASGVLDAAKPLAGYANDSNPNRDFKLNILLVHDEKNRRNPTYQTALATLNYAAGGLYPTAVAGTPVSCTACHASGQLTDVGITAPGIDGVVPLTTAMHGYHAQMVDPATNDLMDNGTDRSSCYRCHAGTHTQALRGAMSKSVATDGSLQIQCQSCHGKMSALADTARRGWIDLPNCQACHAGGQRLTNALDSNGALVKPADTTFATTLSQPVSGASLYRFSTGHGNLQCSACHGSTHAELPSAQANDNLQANDLTGTTGAIRDCTTCHQSGISSTNGGPHGMHSVGATWVNQHQGVSSRGTTCTACHGTDFRGTALSASFATRTLSTSFGTIQMYRGFIVSCYTCHNGTGGNGNGSSLPTPAVSNTSANAVSGQSATIPIIVTNSGVLRIVSQPAHGSARASGNAVIYSAPLDFEGSETITYAAHSANGRDSNLGTATVRVAAGGRPSISTGGVTSAASYVAGVAPGMITYISGSGLGPTALGLAELNSGGFLEKAAVGTRVLFDGVASPIVYASYGAVAAIAPYGIAGKTSTNVAVEYNGVASSGTSVPVSAALPGLFTANASGSGTGAVVNQDGSINSITSPAVTGSVVSLYLTGEGAVTGGIDGKLAVAPYPTPLQKVTVTIGGQPADVQYAGGAPGQVAGLMQVNAVVPIGLAAGTASVAVTVGGITSKSGVTLEVK